MTDFHGSAGLNFDMTGVFFAPTGGEEFLNVKDILTKILLVAICLHGLAFHAKPKGPVFYDLVAAFNLSKAEELDKEFAHKRITHLFVSDKILQYRLDGVPFQVRWIGEPARLLMFNGRIFSAEEIRSEENFVKAFNAKFGIKSRNTAALDATTEVDLDEDIFGPPLEASAEEGDPRDEIEFEDDEGEVAGNESKEKNSLTEFVGRQKIFEEGSIFHGTQFGEDTENMLGALGNLGLVAKQQQLMLSAMACGMDPSARSRPGVAFDDMSEFDPRKIPFPKFDN